MLLPLLGTVAPAIPEFGALAGLFFAILGVIMARGAIATWTHSFGYLLEWLASKLNVKVGTWFGTIHLNLGKPFHDVDSWVLTALQDWLRGSEIEMTYFLHASAVLWDWTVAEVEKLARDSVGWAGWAQHVFVPAFVHAVTWPIVHGARAVKSVAVDAYDLGLKGERRWREVEHGLGARIREGLRKWGPYIFPGILLIPELIKEWHGISHRLARHNRRLHALEVATGAAAFAALMANSLGLGHNWRCITRGNVGRMARFLCGTPTWLLDFLILGTLETFVARDLCGFTDLLIKEAEAIRPALLELVDVEDALIGCNGTVKPLAFKLPPLSLPPMPGPSAFAA